MVACFLEGGGWVQSGLRRVGGAVADDLDWFFCMTRRRKTISFEELFFGEEGEGGWHRGWDGSYQIRLVERERERQDRVMWIVSLRLHICINSMTSNERNSLLQTIARTRTLCSMIARQTFHSAPEGKKLTIYTDDLKNKTMHNVIHSSFSSQQKTNLLS